jgi:hypothetical protein
VTHRHEIARAGTLLEPAQHSPSCRCLKRRTQQSGEVRSDRSARSDAVPLAPATPLTGFLPRPGYAPPKVIVSHLLAGAPVEVMVFENAPYDLLSFHTAAPAASAKSDLLAMEDFGFSV